MTLDRLIQQLEELRDCHGGDTRVSVATQPNYPLWWNCASPVCVQDTDEEVPVVFIPCGSQNYDMPYAPREVFE